MLTRVVGTANSDLLAHGVLDVDTSNTLNAKLLGQRLIGKVELAVLALNTTNGLAGRTLGAGPLGLLVSGGAGIGAHGSGNAGVAGNTGNDGVDNLVDDGHVLDTGPTTKAKVVEGNGTVFRGEGVAVKLAIGELLVHAGGRGRAAARAAGGGAGGGSGVRAAGLGAAGAGAGAARVLVDGDLDELSSSLDGSRGSRAGGARRHSRRGGLANIRRHVARELQSTLGDTIAGLLEGNDLAVENEGGDGRAGHRDDLGVGGALVVMAVLVVVLSRHHAGGSQGEGDSIELHRVGYLFRTGLQAVEYCVRMWT